MTPRLILLAVVGMAALMAVFSCDNNPVATYEPDVINTLDNFHFRIDDVSDHDTSLTYYWRTNGTSANINQLSSITGGRALLTIVDSTSSLVYDTDFAQSGDFQSGSGLSGRWRITVRLISFSGMIDFRVQSR